MNRKISWLFLFLLFLTRSANTQNLDIRWLDKINSPANPRADKPWQFVTDCMAPVGIAMPVTLFVAGVAGKDQYLRTKSYEAGASFLLSSALSMATKITVRRPRPFVTYPEIITKKSKGGSFSFPSGHTAVAFATATSLSLTYPKWYVIAPSFAYAGAVAYSRMYLGVHYPSDLLGGILIGVGASLLTYQVGRWVER